MLEMTIMSAITERFVFGKTATTDGQNFPTLQTVHITISINDLEIALYFHRTVVVDC